MMVGFLCLHVDTDSNAIVITESMIEIGEIE